MRPSCLLRPFLAMQNSAAPLLAAAVVLAAAADAQEPARPTTFDTGERLRVVVWGDAAAVDTAAACAAGLDLPTRLRGALADLGLDAEVLAAGLDGLTLEQHAARLARDVLSADPHVVVLAFHGDGDDEALLEFFKDVVFRLHTLDSHVVFLPPLANAVAGAGADAGARADADAGRSVEAQNALLAVYGMAAAWFGEPLVVVGDAPGGSTVEDEIATLHAQRNLLARRGVATSRYPEPPHALDPATGLLPTLPGSGMRLAGLVPGSGDFRLAADLVLEKRDHTAASFRFDGGHFGFDGASNALFLEGPAFGGGPRFLASPLQDGKPFRFVVERRGADLRFRIDGRLLAATRWPQPIEMLGFRPHRGVLEVRGAWLSGQAVHPATLPAAPGYTIPLLDLAADRARQVVVDREPGQYLGHPTTFLAEDGRTLHVVYPKGHGKGPIVYQRSTDGGLSWSGRLPVPESWASSQEVPTLYRTVDAAGVPRLILFSGLSPIRMAVSEDDGASWSELQPIGDYGGIVAMASCVPAGAPGRYLAWFHDDGRFMPEPLRPDDGAPFHVYQVESLDGGLTWGPPRAIVSHPLAHLCEPGVVKSPDGRRLALLLRENSRVYNSMVVFSDDAGATWSAPRQLPAALTGDRHTAKYAPDGRLVVTFRDTTRESPTQGDWVAWVGHWQDLVDGSEGQYRARLMDNLHAWDCAYPGLELLPDGTFVATTYGHWTEGEEPWIVSVRFTLDELDAQNQ